MNEQHDDTQPLTEGLHTEETQPSAGAAPTADTPTATDTQPSPEKAQPPGDAPLPTDAPPETRLRAAAPPSGEEAPAEPAPGIPHAAPTPGAVADPSPNRRPRPRTGPIVWGALILAFCGYIAQRVFGTAELDAGWWIAATTIALGALLLLVGAAVVVRGRR
ncbi:hypothetical protein [Leucobacter ruminantium]|uniref:Uncharacterized protein n=1 Tax=Leucobacter ruminantium TaxID=1289170 RepID=A0A939LYY9_9MICO|nr:hypothetical protein [Leucobacter ruminantium]MBO1805513.1 hypothetical protein [Leucobacter ruminantium]